MSGVSLRHCPGLVSFGFIERGSILLSRNSLMLIRSCSPPSSISSIANTLPISSCADTNPRKLSGAFLLAARPDATVDTRALWEKVTGEYVFSDEGDVSSDARGERKGENENEKVTGGDVD